MSREFNTELEDIRQSIDSLLEVALEIKHKMLMAHVTGAKLSKDVDQWCFLLGENLMEGIAGFGNTVHDAALDFERAYYKEKA